MNILLSARQANIDTIQILKSSDLQIVSAS